MKTITTNVKIQFDQFVNGCSEQYVMETLNRINEVLQREFNDISPQIFANNIDGGDIEIANEMFDKNNEQIEIDYSVDVDNIVGSHFDFNGTVVGFDEEYVLVQDMDGDVFSVLPVNIEVV